MSQALHTASTGINAGQKHINVIANNVANINTTAFKAANMVFDTLYSNNLSYGSAATKDGGGTNPKQIGLGVKVGGITRNFGSGEYVSTGRDMDLMISGNGFFVVKDADGKQYFTRDGVFSLDSDGNVCTQSGMKVVAAKTIYSNASTEKTVSVPKNLKAVVQGDPNIGTKKISELNNASITEGNVAATIQATRTLDDGTVEKIPLKILLSVPDGDSDINKLITNFNTAINTAIAGANQGLGDADPKFSTDVLFTAADGKISYSGPDNISFVSEGTTSNFLAQTGLIASNVSNDLSQTAKLQDVVNYNDANDISLESTTVDENGILIATYDDGSILTQFVEEGTEAIKWRYTTPEGVVISEPDIEATGSSMQNSNFVIELATMVNEEGLVSVSNNLWEWGSNVGEVYYGMAGEMAFGSIETGGYEGSNVDIAFELTNMISAQRMIQMNSRVFSTASSVMETLAYLGQ